MSPWCCVPCGSLAPDGAVVKTAGLEQIVAEGTARVFDGETAAMAAVTDGTITAGDVVVIRWEGPRGGPGMREMLTDGRFSGATSGPCIGHVAPEAADWGPIALVADGDRIRLDVPARRLDLLVGRPSWRPAARRGSPARRGTPRCAGQIRQARGVRRAGSRLRLN